MVQLYFSAFLACNSHPCPRWLIMRVCSGVYAVAVIRGANDFCTIVGLVLTAGGILVRSGSSWTQTSALKTQTMTALAVAAFVAVGAMAVSESSRVAEFGQTVLTGHSARAVQGNHLIGLVSAAYLLEVAALVLTVLGWVFAPISASRPKRPADTEGKACSACEGLFACCGTVLPGCDDPEGELDESDNGMRIPGGCLPQPAVATGLFAFSGSAILALVAFPSLGTVFRQGFGSGSLREGGSLIGNHVLKLLSTAWSRAIDDSVSGRVSPVTLTRAADAVLLACLVVAVAMMVLRLVVSVPARVLYLRDGPSQLAATVAVGATLVAVCVYGLDGMGRGGQWLADAIEVPLAAAVRASSQASAQGSKLWLDLVQQAPELARAEWWYVLAQFGLLIASAMLALPSAMGVLVIAAVYWGLAEFWGAHPLQSMLQKPGMKIL
jgi:hypothetical protein